MIIEFRGVRGSIPVPEKAMMKYGGNTTCLHVVDNHDRDYIFDAGTGIRRLGQELFTKRGPTGTYNLLLTHGHFDHIQGLPFFRPAYSAGTQIHVYSAGDQIVELIREQQKQADTMTFTRSDLEARAKAVSVTNRSATTNRVKTLLFAQQNPKNFPLTMDKMASDMYFYDLKEREVVGKEFRVTPTLLTSHPQGMTSYLLQEDDGSAFFVGDHEHDGEKDFEFGYNDRKIIAAAADVDVIILDAQYTPPEYQFFKTWGHSQMERACQLAVAARAKNVIITHHDPNRVDGEIDLWQQKTRDYMKNTLREDINVYFAMEGMKVSIGAKNSVQISYPAVL